MLVPEVKETQALRCPRTRLNHPSVEQMIRRTPFPRHPAATLWARPTSWTPEPRSRPRATFWCPTPLSLVCLWCIHTSVLILTDNSVFQTLNVLYVFVIPLCLCECRLCFLERHPVRLLVRRDTRPHSWWERCHGWLGHDVDDGELALAVALLSALRHSELLNSNAHMWLLPVLVSRSTTKSPRTLRRGSTSRCLVPSISSASFSTFKPKHSGEVQRNKSWFHFQRVYSIAVGHDCNCLGLWFSRFVKRMCLLNSGSTFTDTIMSYLFFMSCIF